MSSHFVVSAALAASVFVGGAMGDIGTPTWNWSYYGNWGHGHTATYGQTFVGNGELATGARFRFYDEHCCASRSFRVALCRWDDSNNRAIMPILAQGDSTYSNYGCCWFDREVTFSGGVALVPGVKYVVFASVTPTYQTWCCSWARFAIHTDGNYPSGQMFILGNGSNASSWFNTAWSSTGYDLNFTVRTTGDCDGNGIVDATELAKGSADDCNEDSVIDSCQGNVPQDITLSATQGPIGTGIERQFLFQDVVPSDGNVTLTIEASGDLSATHEFLLMSIAGGTPTPIFTGTQSDCSALSTQFTFTEAQFDQFIAGGDLDIRITASGTVDPTACGGASSVSVSVAYRERYVDCNGNGVPDPLDICSTATPDCNGNFIPDSCDIAAGASVDLDSNAQPDECQFDCNNDDRPDMWQIATGELPDCNLNGVLDVCDLSAGTSQDCNGNSIPDSCDINSGTSPDCDSDGVVDGCAISAGAVPDCNANLVPDSCDLASGIAFDCNLNAVPDSCDVTRQLQYASPTQTPFHSGSPLSVAQIPVDRTVWQSPLLEVEALTYTYGYYGYNVTIYLDGEYLGSHYYIYWGGCNGGYHAYSIPLALWSSVASDGFLGIQVVSNHPSNCSGTYCRVRLSYPESPDCNSNSIPDSCDLKSGAAPDCNANGLIDTCEITSGAEDKNANGHLDACELLRGDLDLDGVVGGGDLAVLLSLWGVTGSPVGDLTGDGTIDAMDATILLGNWGTTP